MRRMRLRLGVVATVALVGLTTSGAGTSNAAPERDMVIRMGKGIGKVDLGMTLPQVRRAFGKPHLSVIRRIDFGNRGRYLELGWELPGRRAWEPTPWAVGFRSWTRRGPLRVVRVSTTAGSERTPQGLGIGNRPRQLVRAYPNATCVSRDSNLPTKSDWVVVDAPRGGMTAFQLDTYEDWQRVPSHRVVEVMVQYEWFSQAGHRDCPRVWKLW